MFKRKKKKIDSQLIKEQCDGLRKRPGGGMMFVPHLDCAGVCGQDHGHVWGAGNTMVSAAVTRGVAGHLLELVVSTQDSFTQTSTFGHWQKVRD